MDREAFEQLVSTWLDEPEREDLHARIDAAVAGSAELAQLREAWLRLDRLVRQGAAGVERVDWERLRSRIVAAAETGDALSEGVRDLTDIEQQVDWPRLQRRIAEAVAVAAGAPPAVENQQPTSGEAPDATPHVIRFPFRRTAGVVAMLGAAAAVVLMLTLPAQRSTGPVGFAAARVTGPADALAAVDHTHALVQVTVSAPAEAEDGIDEQRPRERSLVEPQLAEVFLMVAPARPPGELSARLTPFGFN
jgi:hypothetical protein